MSTISRNKRLGQTFAEYGICIAAVAVCLLGMTTYVKRSLQSRYRDAAHAPALAAANTSYGQIEPYYANTTATIQANATSDLRVFPDQTRRMTIDEKYQGKYWQRDGYKPD